MLNQRTLSIRIPEAVRNSLARTGEIFFNRLRISPAKSDKTKRPWQSATDPQSDELLELRDLQARPTEALWAIRRKWEFHQDLSHAEWILVAQYVAAGCQDVTRDPFSPAAESFAQALEALLAVRALRLNRDIGVNLDRYYLQGLVWNPPLRQPDPADDPDAVPQAVTLLIHELRLSAEPYRPVYVGRCLLMAITEESLEGIASLNRALFPYLPVLYGLAARGHYLRERCPVRSVRAANSPMCDFFKCLGGADDGVSISIMVTDYGELEMLIDMRRKQLAYPLGPYPRILEFESMLARLEGGRRWTGRHFLDTAATRSAITASGSRITRAASPFGCLRTSGNPCGSYSSRPWHCQNYNRFWRSCLSLTERYRRDAFQQHYSTCNETCHPALLRLAVVALRPLHRLQVAKKERSLVAIYHCQTNAIGRSSGRSAVAAAAFRAGTCLRDERQGITHDYSGRCGVMHTQLVLPDGAGAWTRSELWNAAERAEKQKNSRTAREWEVALPSELGVDARRELVLRFARGLASKYGYAVDVALHEANPRGDRRNWHAYLLATTRKVHAGTLRQKCDIELSDRTRLSMGLAPARVEVTAVRQIWAQEVNQALEQAGCPERVDHRSLVARREEALQKGDHAKAAERDRAPQIKLGKAAQMERPGKISDRGDQLRQVQAENVERKALVFELDQLRKQLAERQSGNTPAVPDR